MTMFSCVLCFDVFQSLLSAELTGFTRSNSFAALRELLAADGPRNELPPTVRPLGIHGYGTSP